MTLSASNSFTIDPGAAVTETAEAFVLPVAGPGDGTGRLIHPTLGTFDYGSKPDSWAEFRTDAIVPPLWSSTQTLGGAALTLWEGQLGDVVVAESWNAGELALTTDDYDTLLAFWQAPPNPNDGFPAGWVQWWPSYASDLGFYVAILNVTNGEGGRTFDPVSESGWIVGPVVITMQIRARVV